MRDVNQTIMFGADYNPEQWDEAIWIKDMELMKKAGINTVSIGIFSWALIQPGENSFDFAWLDKVIDLLEKNNIKIDIATPTAAQPAWLSKNYPQILPVDNRGVRLSYGSRQTYCPNSEIYREFSGRIVRKLAERYGRRQNLVMWHIHNEYTAHTRECYCENCEREYRVWLEKRYKSLEKFNNAWGTNFWSQKYYKWDEVIAPKYTAADINPMNILDYTRFMNESLLQCLLNEKNILKEVTPNIPVTTNFTQFCKYIDCFQWAKELDVVSVDNYPSTNPNHRDTPLNNSFLHELMRGLKDGKPHLLMEQATNQVNWGLLAIRPGTVRLWSYQALAHGADGVSFFQWRQSLRGSERFHSAIVTHLDSENTRVFRQISQIGQEFNKIGEITGSTEKSKVAIMFDYENYWAVEGGDLFRENLWYKEQIIKYYRPFYENNIPVDFIPYDKCLDEYKVVIAPLMYMIKDDVADRIDAYVKNGGVFINTFFSGIVNEEEAIFPGGAPGPLKDILGIYVEEFDALCKDITNKICINSKSFRANNNLKETYSCSTWCEMLHTTSAETLATFKEDYYSGFPAVTRNYYGTGSAYYIATSTDDCFVSDFIKYICKETDINALINTSEKIEVTMRVKNNIEYMFLINHGKETDVTLPQGEYIELISLKKCNGFIHLNEKDCYILKREEITGG